MRAGASTPPPPPPAGRLYSRSCEEGDVHEPRDADHLLLGQDGLHGLLDGVERLQGGDQAPQLLPAAPVRRRIFFPVSQQQQEEN